MTQNSTQPHTLESLTYEPLPWSTHPIDIAHGSQGWGPMDGPYTPFDFASPAMAGMGGQGIDIYWTQGNNSIMYSPPWAVKTVFEDPSQALVNNSHHMAAIFQGSKGSSTIQQGPAQTTPQATGKGALLMNAIRAALGVGV
jgi:hypothetical protein